MTKSTTKFKILVVDDEREIVIFLADALQTSGHTVVQANDGQAALAIIAADQKEKSIDLVITDVRMPKVSGLEVLKKLKELNIPTIVMTAYAEDLDFKRAEDLGACDFLKKPFGLEELENSLTLAMQIDKKVESEPVDLDREYCQVHIDQFLSGSTAFQDVFLRLSHEKYLRIARAASPLSMDRMKLYKNKGLNYLFIKKDDFAAYVGFNIKLAQAANSGRVPVSMQAKLQLIRQSGEAYAQNLFVNGISEENFSDGKVLIETALNLLTEADNVYELLEMLRNHSNVIFSHSLGVSLYAGLAAKELGWSNPSIRFKVALAGILHDIGKKEIPSALLNKDRMEMTAEEIAIYESHPLRGRDLLLKIPFISDEVVQAVAHHHEDMKGMGFPSHLPRSKIHPIAKLIFVVDEFCHWCLSGPTGKGLEPKEALEKMYASKGDDYDLEMLKALMVAVNCPVPERLRNMKSKLGS